MQRRQQIGREERKQPPVTAVLQAPRARQDPRLRQEGVRAPAEVGAVFDASVSSS